MSRASSHSGNRPGAACWYIASSAAVTTWTIPSLREKSRTVSRACAAGVGGPMIDVAGALGPTGTLIGLWAAAMTGPPLGYCDADDPAAVKVLALASPPQVIAPPPQVSVSSEGSGSNSSSGSNPVGSIRLIGLLRT